jgi:hypothetical protein
MVAVHLPLLSDQPPESPRRVGLGDRFHYFRGQSGRRYLFTQITADALPDFRNAVLLTTAPTPAGRLSVRSMSLIGDNPDAPEMLHKTRRRAPVMLIHLLADTSAERVALVEDLIGVPLALAA